MLLIDEMTRVTRYIILWHLTGANLLSSNHCSTLFGGLD